MNLRDLMLLVDVAYHERDGQQGTIVGADFGAAADRLVAGALIIRNPSRREQVTITPAGLKAIDSLVERLESAAIVAAVGEFISK